MEFAKDQAIRPLANLRGGKSRDALVCVALVVATLLVYFQTFHFDFVSHDDPLYVYDNPHVKSGLTLANVKWSWTHVYDTNWIPFTFMSLMADTSLFGFKPSGYHITNTLLHVANALLLYLALAAATGARAKSAVVAALFALHPLHVESVAWISERKDVLSTFFGFLSLFCYVRYATRGRWWRLTLSALFFGCSLLSKQTFVTLPFLLLLLDYWPLRRLELGRGRAPQPASTGDRAAVLNDADSKDTVSKNAGSKNTVLKNAVSKNAVLKAAGLKRTRSKAASSTGAISTSAGSKVASSKPVATVESAPSQKHPSLGRLIVEKLPFFLLSGGFSAIAMFAQDRSVISLNTFPLAWRLQNAIYVYVAYLQKAIFPHDLAVFYPHPLGKLSWIAVALSALLLVATTAVVLACHRRYPFLPVGWFWYLGTLVPLIGLVQIGWQQMADRYTYLSLVGVFIAVTWLVPELIPPGLLRRMLLPAAVAVSLALLMAVAYEQVAVWHDGVTLTQHSMACTPDNAAAHDFLGEALFHENKWEEGCQELEKCARMSPSWLEVRLELGNAYRNLGRYDRSIAHYKKALALNGNSVEGHRGLGLTYVAREQYAEAEVHYRKALEINPQCVDALINMASLKYATDDNQAAIEYSEQALKLSPKSRGPQICIAVALRQQGHFDEAIQRLEYIVEQSPSDRKAKQILERTRALKENAASSERSAFLVP
jgi:protein O-mannosyl-transferase